MLPLNLRVILKQFFYVFVITCLYNTSHNVLQLENIKTNPLKRSIVDNITHIALGIVSWAVSLSYAKTCQPWNVGCCLLCGILAGFVDIDHFLMAKSFNLGDAMNLSSRPPFHNTTLMFSIIVSYTLFLYIAGFLKVSFMGWILLVAVVSHHLRDSLHRGLWLWPVQLKPMKMISCLLLSYCFPMFVGILIHYLYGFHSLTTKYNDSIV